MYNMSLLLLISDLQDSLSQVVKSNLVLNTKIKGAFVHEALAFNNPSLSDFRIAAFPHRFQHEPAITNPSFIISCSAQDNTLINVSFLLNRTITQHGPRFEFVL